VRCEDVTELLSGYLDNALDQDERSWVEEHLRHCPHCASELAALRATLALVQELDEVEPPPDFRVNLRKRIVSERRRERLGFLGRVRRGLATATAPYRGVVAVAATLAVAIGISAGIQSPSTLKWLGLAQPAPSVAVGQAGHEAGAGVKALPTQDRTLAAKGAGTGQAGTGQAGTTPAGPQATTANPPQAPSQSSPPTPDSKATGQVAMTANLPRDDATKAGTGSGETSGAQATGAGATAAATKTRSTAIVGQAAAAAGSESSSGTGGGTTDAAQSKSGAGLSPDLLELLRPAVGKSASLTLEVRNVDDAVLKISQLAEKDSGLGAGYVEEATTSTEADGRKHALLRLKVPAAGLQDCLAQIEKLGVLRRKSVTGQEMSVDYSDAEARLKIYKQQESRYMEILARANTVDDIVRLQNELAVVQTNIELLQGRLDLLKNQTVYSSVTVEMSQSDSAAAPPPAGGTLGQVGEEAGKSFLLTSRGLEALAVRAAGIIGGAGPVLILLGLGWLAYLVYHRTRPERARGRG